MTTTTAPSPTAAPPRARLGFVLAVATATVMMAGASAPSPFYPVLQERLGYSPGTSTAIFGVYAITLLATLLVLGSVSDHVGRRPVISGALVLLTLSVVLFWHADTVSVLLLARAVQGVASALLLSTLSAAVVDFESPDHPDSAALWNTVSPLAGLASGALAAGLVLDVSPGAAEAEVFGGLTIAYLALALAAWSVPETAPRHAGLAASLLPRVALPAAVRPLFLLSFPALLAGWATGGLYLSLTPLVVSHELGGTGHAWQGLAIAALAGTGALSCFLVRDWSPRRITLYGTTTLAVGTALTLIAISLGPLVAFLLAVVVAGSGFGTAFMGVLRSIVPAIPPAERGEVFAAIFVVSYLSLGVPATIAGMAVEPAGLGTTTLVYGIGVALLAAVAAVLRAFTTRD
ncbi:putative MFS family arabinose efflux permease [Mumia flava]|uniref:Putative MFS family arabinose efflux permease n=1 Tax=Mumia flava TaxID=1348852 RepID=A0A2M9AQC2_9ACTN|nr:MFS transporter [Mumia flava]PJJ47843.1 putative MFS family arabinose efflux permease [Mumia flava]